MAPWISWLIAAASFAAFAILWCWEVRRVLNDRKSTVDSAAEQWAAFRRRVAESPCDQDLAAVLLRSESICRQAVDNYNRIFHRPWGYLPARLMGFRRAEEPAGSVAGESLKTT